MPDIEVEVALRERNQITLPDRIATRLGVQAGDRLIARIADQDAGAVVLRPVRRSYAGVAGDLYGGTQEEAAAYIAGERGSWETPSAPPGQAGDGTPYLSLEESKRVYRQTEVTRERYEREPKLKWRKCEICGRSIARMREHMGAHRDGRLNDAGISTDKKQAARSRRRVAKWRTAIAVARRDPGAQAR